MPHQVSSFTIARRRPLILIGLWLLLTLATIPAPRPRPATGLGPESQGPAATTLRRAFDLPAEPTLLVFRRPDGLTQADEAHVERVTRGLQSAGRQVSVHGCDGGATCVASLEADAADVPHLRAAAQDETGDLEVYVTGWAAFAHDATVHWSSARLAVLVGATVIGALVALLGKLGPRRSVVVGVSAGGTGTVTSALAALVAPPSPVALSTVVSAGLAGAWAVRLLTPRRLERPRSTASPAPEAPSGPTAGAPPPRKLTLLQSAIIQTGEGTLLQGLIVAAGLSGFLFDLHAGAALLLGLTTAVAFSLSGTPALIALLTRPRRPRVAQDRTRRRKLRLVLALIPTAGLLWLTPTAHPADGVPRQLESAAGYELLVNAAETGKQTLGHALPVHLLLRATGVARSESGLAALRNLVANLSARPGLAAVEGAAALQTAPYDEGSSNPAANIARLDHVERMAADLEAGLQDQADALLLVAADLQSLDLTARDTFTAPLITALDEAGESLGRVRDDLANARAGLTRVPIEFPELAPRMRDVPALEALPTALDATIAELKEVETRIETEIEAALQRAAAQRLTSTSDHWIEIHAALASSLAELKALVAEATLLRTELGATEAMWAGVALGDSSPAAPNPYLVSHDLIRLVLVPEGDPYAAATLNEAQALLGATGRHLADTPLAESEVALTGAPALAASRRAQALRNQLTRGTFVTALAVALFAWGASSRAGSALRLTIGAVLSTGAGVGLVSAVCTTWRAIGNGGAALPLCPCPMDAQALALVGVALPALTGGRMTTGQVPNVEALALALSPLSLILTGAGTLVTIGLTLSTGLLVSHFLIAPTLSAQPRYNAQGIRGRKT